MIVESVFEQFRSVDDVAIIGMACLFPGAPSVRAYWENIVGKVCTIGDPPPGWADGEIFDPHSAEPDRIYCRKGGFLRDLACFDPLAYGVMPRAVDGAEPEHFLALRVAHEAFADAGYLDRPFNRKKAGVILGRGTFLNRGNVTALQHGLVIDQTLRLLKQLHPEYQERELQILKEQLKASLPAFNAETAPGLVSNVMCGRIANRLDLQGPTYAVDAACASSLIALDLGVRDLQSGRCDLMLVGGVSISTPPIVFMVFCQLGALSRSGQIRPFDAEADGTLLGEGIGMVVLKRLQDARRDGDRVYAVIKGVGVASDGRALAVLAPRLEGEELALRRAYEEAGIPPRSVGLIEAHGTGTLVGDMTEIHALRRVFGERQGPYPHCALGSVKSMISHTIAAAGVAGLIKAALALYHKTLPPTLGCEVPNPKFELEKTPFYVNTETRPWIHGGQEPRRAGVNAFGFGGINTHVVLEEDPLQQEIGGAGGSWETELVILQGASRADILSRGKQLVRYLENSPDVPLRDVAYTLNTELRDDTLRLAIVASSVMELTQKLAYALQRLSDPKRRRIKDRNGIYFFDVPLAREGQLAYLFPGEGAQYTNMLADLCMHFPEVRRCFDQADRVFRDNQRPYVPSQIIFPPPLTGKQDEAALWQVDVAVASVFSANRALATLLSRIGVTPQAIVGHSSGEYTALLAAGAIEVDSEEELLQYGLALNGLYASLEERIPAAVLVAVGAVRPGVMQAVLEQCPGPLYVTMDNCPQQIVLCGTEESTAAATAMLRSRGAICTILPFKRGYHTPLFAPISEELERFFRQLRVVAPRVPLYSCATAGLFPAAPTEVRRLAVSQWSNPVRFRETVEAMWAAGVRIFVEVGPRGNLVGFVDDVLRGKPFVAVPMNTAHRSGITQLNHAVGLLAAHGVSLRLAYLYEHRQPRRLDFASPAKNPVAQKLPLRVALELPTARLDRTGLVTAARSVPEPGLWVTPSQQGNERRQAEILPPLVVPQPPTTNAVSVSHDVLPESKSPPPLPPVSAEVGCDPRSRVMMDYLRTMENFLDVQEDVLRAFLTRGPVHNLSPESRTGQQQGGHAPAEGTVQPPALQEPSAPALNVPAIGPCPLPEDEGGKESPVARFLALISEKTGYPIEMLDPSLHMEADLGIDSIKRIEILGSFQRETGLIRPEDLERVAGCKTLQEIIAFFSKPPENVPPASLTPPPRDFSDGASATPPPVPAGSAVRTPQGRFVRKIASHVAGEEIVVECELDARKALFLRHHTIGGRVSVGNDSWWAMPVVPLTVSLAMMAEVASFLQPGKHLVEIRHVRAARWFALEEDYRSVVIRAKKKPAEGRNSQEAIDVQIFDAEEHSGSHGRIIIQGTILFGESYSSPPQTDAFELHDERPYRYRPEDFYKKVMFHGPFFQSVLSIDRCGREGAQATIRSGRETGFVGSVGEDGLLLDPVFLDAAGQLVGFWTADRLEWGFVVFPLGFESLQFYGPPQTVPRRATCRVRSRLLGDERVCSDVEFVDAAGRVLVQVKNWEDARFDFPRAFVHFVLAPQEHVLSELWPEAVTRFASADELRCCRLRLTNLPEVLSDTRSVAWQHAWARLILSRGEYAQWRTMKMADKRQVEWLMGRLAVKDAVRLLLRDRGGLDLCPADIEVAVDEYGAPFVRGLWAQTPGDAPRVSFSHSHGTAVAVAAERETYERIGIDVETMRELSDDLVSAAFGADEQTLFSRLGPGPAREWRLRCWCAKEALGKALGRGLSGGPLGVVVQAFDTVTGSVSLQVTGKLAREMRFAPGTVFSAETVRDNDLVVACVGVRRSQ